MSFGVCFEPYVGPWDGSQPVLFNAYTLDDVEKMLHPVSQKFTRIRTYGQGTFVWEGTPKIQDSNKYCIAAAKKRGLDVVAGCYQQGADPGGDSINVTWTTVEIDYAIAQATAHGNVVGLVIGNECIWGPNTVKQVKQLVKYAKTKRDAAGFTGATMPITTCQEWGVLAGVNGGPQAVEMKALLDECETGVYANIYPYFDASIAGKLGSKPTQAQFNTAATDSWNGCTQALAAAFTAAGVTLKVWIGETGWPTQGTQPAQQNPIATQQYAQWYYDLAKTLLGAADFYFEAYQEPWKGDEAGDNSEAYFGLWKADGTSPQPGQYTFDNWKEVITV
jgi:exo-beta-1,3-glucanase (GH17 family)